DHLADPLARVELHRGAPDVRELERDRAVEARTDEAGGGVYDHGQPPIAAAPRDARHQIVGEAHPLHGAAEGELAGVQHEGLALGDVDAAGVAGDGVRIAGIDAGDVRQAIDHEGGAEPQIHARRLELEIEI